MSFEPLVVQKWIYDTLRNDATLQALLSGPLAPNYQQGIYNEIAPEKDAISQRMPQMPFIVFSRAGSDGEDQIAMCGSRYQTIPIFRITVWDNNNGSISYQRLKTITDRIDVLLQGQQTTTSGITFFSQRFDTDQPFEINNDGRVDYGLSLLYRFNTVI